MRIRGDADSSRVRIRAVLDGDGRALLDAGVRELFVQLAQDAAQPLTCARVDGARFRLSKRGLAFRDKRGEVFEAAGIDRVKIRVTRGGRTKIRLDARRALFGLPEPGEFRVVVALDRVLVPTNPVVCLRSVSELVSAKRGLKLP